MPCVSFSVLSSLTLRCRRHLFPDIGMPIYYVTSAKCSAKDMHKRAFPWCTVIGRSCVVRGGYHLISATRSLYDACCKITEREEGPSHLNKSRGGDGWHEHITYCTVQHVKLHSCFCTYTRFPSSRVAATSTSRRIPSYTHTLRARCQANSRHRVGSTLDM